MDPTGDAPLSEAELVDLIARLEMEKNALAARQADAIVAFARAHVAARSASGVVEPEVLERSVTAQVGLACRVSPTEGRRRWHMARALHAGHDHVRELFAAGLLSEYKVQTIVAATAHLDLTERAAVDRRLAQHRIEQLGVRRLHDLGRSLAAEAAPDGFLARSRRARSGRRVSVRPGADGMADLIAHLPAEQAVSCYASLVAAVREEAVSPGPVTRGRGQVMADTLVERLTGQATARDVNLEVQVMVPLEALLDPASPLPAQIAGHGPIPAEVLATTQGRTTWRRLVTRDGIVIGGDSRQRAFTGALATLIKARDGGRCREPYCDATIRQIDHIQRWADGGPTSLDNGRGLCEFHNHAREAPGWTITKTGHTITTTTPTGHTYASTLPSARPRADRPPTRARRRRRPRARSRPAAATPAVRSSRHARPSPHADENDGTLGSRLDLDAV